MPPAPTGAAKKRRGRSRQRRPNGKTCGTEFPRGVPDHGPRCGFPQEWTRSGTRSRGGGRVVRHGPATGAPGGARRQRRCELPLAARPFSDEGKPIGGLAGRVRAGGRTSTCSGCTSRPACGRGTGAPARGPGPRSRLPPLPRRHPGLRTSCSPGASVGRALPGRGRHPRLLAHGRPPPAKARLPGTEGRVIETGPGHESASPQSASPICWAGPVTAPVFPQTHFAMMAIKRAGRAIPPSGWDRPRVLVK